MAQHLVLSNSSDGTTRASYKGRFFHTAATAATGSTSFVMPYAGTVVGVYASGLYTQSTDRTDTISVTKTPQNVATGSAVAVLTTSGVLRSEVAGTIMRAIGTSGVTAFTNNINPVLSTTAATVAVAKGDTITITNTTAGSNGSAATQLNICVEVEFELGDDASAN